MLKHSHRFMRDKHIQVPSDSALLQAIRRRVDAELQTGGLRWQLLLLLKLLVFGGTSACCYFFLLHTTDRNLFVLLYVLYGLSTLLFAFNFAHDFSHNAVFRTAKLNEWCFIAIYTAVGAHAEAWKDRHVHSHHYAPNVQDYDSDLKISSLIRVTPGSPYKWYNRFQHFYAPFAYLTYSLFWIFIKDFVILFSPGPRQQKGITHHFSFWLQKTCYFTLSFLVPFFFSGQSWQVILFAYLCMHAAQSIFLLFTFFMTHHVESTAYPQTNAEGYIQSSWLMNQVMSSNDMHPFSFTANFILGGFNNHVAHHLFPNIHHVHYPQLSRIIYKVLAEQGIVPNQTSYLGGIRSHLRLLRRMSVPWS